MTDNPLSKLKDKLLLSLFKFKSRLDHLTIVMLYKIPFKLLGVSLLLLAGGSFLVLYLMGFSLPYIMYLYWRMLRRLFVVPATGLRALI